MYGGEDVLLLFHITQLITKLGARNHIKISLAHIESKSIDILYCRMGRSVEQIIRDNGAVPATIALMSGKAYIGISDGMLEQISDTSNHQSVKVSRRDLAYALNMVCIQYVACVFTGFTFI